MSVTTPIRRMTLLYRPATSPHDYTDMLEGDVYEIVDIPIYEVDPVTRTAKTTLQCFRVGKNKSLHPVRRDSWLLQTADPKHRDNPRPKEKPRTALEVYERKTGIVSRKAKMR